MTVRNKLVITPVDVQMCGTCHSPKCTCFLPKCSIEHLLKSAYLLQVDTNSESGVQHSEPRGSAVQPSAKDEQGAAGEGSNERAHCEVCDLAGHNKEACPVVKAAQQEEEKEQEAAQQEDQVGWQTVSRDVKPCKAESQSKQSKGQGKKKEGKGKRKGVAVTVRKDGTIIR